MNDAPVQDTLVERYRQGLAHCSRLNNERTATRETLWLLVYQLDDLASLLQQVEDHLTRATLRDETKRWFDAHQHTGVLADCAQLLTPTHPLAAVLNQLQTE